MKKTIQFFLLLAIVCGSYFATGQNNQLKLWSNSSSYWDFTSSTLHSLPNPGIASYNSTCMYDQYGQLYFFIKDQIVYDNLGSIIGTLWTTGTNGSEFSDMEIVPFNNSTDCAKYYVFYFCMTTGMSQSSLLYSIVDMDLYQVTQGAILSTTDGNFGGLAVTKPDVSTGDRFLYAVRGQMGDAGSGIVRYTINSTISTSVTMILADNTIDYQTQEADLSPDGTKLAWGSSFSTIDYHVINLVTGSLRNISVAEAPNEHTSQEFSPNGNKLFFLEGNYTPTVQWIDLTNPSSTPQPTTGCTLQHWYGSKLELGYDNLIYAANATTLQGIDPTTNTVINTIPFAPVYNIACNFYNLPSQIDGWNYEDQFNNLDQYCCIIHTAYNVGHNPYIAGTPPFTSTTQTWTPNNNPFGGTTTTPVSTVTVKSSIVIPEGYNITISGMTFKFAPRLSPTKGAYMIVENGISLTGGRLTLDNTTLKSDIACGPGMWEGVWVVGNKTAAQGNFATSKQGWLIVKNNSLIEDAYYGVLAGRFVGDDPLAANLNPLTTGGVVRAASKSKFINNYIDVKFDSYNTAPGISVFSDCTFETNIQPLLDVTKLPYVHAYIIDETNLRFIGCTFQNTSPLYQPYNWYSGVGIIGINAGFSVIPFGTAKCNFNNLNYGILAWNLNLRYVIVNQSKFTNNYRGIWFNNVNRCTITSNDFYVFPYMAGGGSQFAAYGLYLNYCKSFHVEDNLFTTVGLKKYANDYGIIVNEENPNRDCGQYDEIYRNRFHDILVGCQAQGNNSEKAGTPVNPCYYPFQVPNNIGVNFRCNDFFYNTMGMYDINVTDDNGTNQGNIAFQQGFVYGTDPMAPSGNQFSHSFCPIDQSPVPTNNNDYAITATATLSNPTNINYTMHANNNGRTWPYCYTPFPPNGVLLTNSTLPFDASTACKPKIILYPCPDCLKKAIADYQNKIDSINTILSNGDAQSLMTVISSGNPGQIKNALLAESPYLSDRVLIATVNKGLPPGILKDIIIPNSPVTQDVHSALNAITLPQGIHNQINAAQTGVSGRSEIENLQSYLIGQKSYAIDELIRYSLADTNNASVMDSVIYLMKYYNLPETQYEVAKEYLAKGDTTAAKQIRDSLMMAGVDVPFCRLMDVLIKYLSYSGDYKALAADAQVAASLNTVSADAGTREYVSAVGLLKLIFGGSYAEWIEPLNNNQNNRLINNSQLTSNVSSGSSLIIYPNPTNDNSILSYMLPENSISASIIIYDITGRVVHKHSLSISDSQIEIPSSTFNNGIYFCTLILNEVATDKIKLVVIK